MAPAPKKSKFTMSAAAGSSSRASGSKAAGSSKAKGKRPESKEEQLSDLDEDSADGLDSGDDGLELDEELGGDDEFDLDADMASSDGEGEADTDDEIEEAGRAASKSKKTAST